MLEKSSQFLSSDQPCEPKSLDVALKITGVKKYPRKTCGYGQPRGHLIRVLSERSVNDGGDSSVVGDSQISLMLCRRYILAAILLTVSCG